MVEEPDRHIAAQIDALSLDPEQPLIISDADEVILEFVKGLEAYLEQQGMYLELTSYALTGNIRDTKSREAVSSDAVKELLANFFADRTAHVSPVPGAADALRSLSGRTQIVVLTNVPLAQREVRQNALAAHGMNYPVVANSGAKGAAVARMAGRTEAPVFFLDDIPRNIASVAQHAAHVVRLHFVADPRLARLIEPAEDSHARHDDWPSARAYIEAHLSAKGY